MKVVINKTIPIEGPECMAIHVVTKPRIGELKDSDFYEVIVEEPEENDFCVSSTGWIVVSHHSIPRIDWSHSFEMSCYEVEYLSDIYSTLIAELPNKFFP